MRSILCKVYIREVEMMSLIWHVDYDIMTRFSQKVMILDITLDIFDRTMILENPFSKDVEYSN